MLEPERGRNRMIAFDATAQRVLGGVEDEVPHRYAVAGEAGADLVPVGLDQARQAWNLAVDQQPVAVATVTSVRDVRTW